MEPKVLFAICYSYVSHINVIQINLPSSLEIKTSQYSGRISNFDFILRIYFILPISRLRKFLCLSFLYLKMVRIFKIITNIKINFRNPLTWSSNNNFYRYDTTFLEYHPDTYIIRNTPPHCSTDNRHVSRYPGAPGEQRKNNCITRR